ncbi:MAG: hypothetical protein AAFV45_12890 [Pseudomonadota bacterium]
MSTTRKSNGTGSDYANQIPVVIPAGFAGSDAMVTMFRSMARYQLEVWALTSRRAQAYMELPSKLARCKSTEDFAKAQSRFAETSFRQYSQATERLTDAWSQVLSLPTPTAVANAEVQEPLVFSKPVEALLDEAKAPVRRPSDRIVPRHVERREEQRQVA